MQHTLMAIAIHHYDIARCNRGMPNDFVRCGSAIGHKEAMVCAKNACRISLRGRNGPRVIQKLAKFIHCVTHIGTQHVLAKELVKHLAHGRL